MVASKQSAGSTQHTLMNRTRAICEIAYDSQNQTIDQVLKIYDDGLWGLLGMTRLPEDNLPRPWRNSSIRRCAMAQWPTRRQGWLSSTY